MVAEEVERLVGAPGLLSPPVYVDVGCDHAGLPLTLLHQGALSRAIAVDVHEAPCSLARENARKLGLELDLDVRLSDGLERVHGWVDVVSICGMGSATAVGVLDAARARVGAAIVQPNDTGETVRRWAARVGWAVARERGCWDAGRYYGVLVLVPQVAPDAPDALELAWGVRAQRDVDALGARLAAEIQRLEALGKPASLARLAEQHLTHARRAHPP